MLEVKAFKVDYRRLNPNCNYCDQASTVIRITTMTDGSLMVATLCDKDHGGEVNKCLEDGMVMAGQGSLSGFVTDATLIDERVIEEAQRTMIKSIGEQMSNYAFLEIKEFSDLWVNGVDLGDENERRLYKWVTDRLRKFCKEWNKFEPWEPEAVVAIAEELEIPLEKAGLLTDAAGWP